MTPGLSKLEIIPFKVAAYNKLKKEMDYFDPKRKDDFIFISGTMMRNLAKNNQDPPEGFMDPAAWAVLSEYYQSLKSDVWFFESFQGFVVF